MALTGIESAFCTEWSEWDELETGTLMFFNPVLKPEFNEIVGINPDSLTIDMNNNIVQFYKGEQVVEFKLVVALGDKI